MVLSESQQSNWSLTEEFRKADMDSDDEGMNEPAVVGKKRKAGAISKSENSQTVEEPVKEEEEEPTEEDLILQEYAELQTQMEATTRVIPFSMIALVGKKSGGAIYVPQECVFVVNHNDPDQIKQAKIAIVKKAREWKKNNPTVINPFQMITATGASSLTITAVGGSEYGCSSMPKTKPKKAPAKKKKTAKKSKKM